MNLIENGKDSLKKAIKKLDNLHKGFDSLEYECTLKDIIINLHHSIETMFKYMIKEKDEFLLYSNCDDIFKARVLSKFNTPKKEDIKTIQFLDSVDRVIVLYNIDIVKEDYNKFKTLNEIRNSLTHYERDFSDNEIEHLIALVLPIILKIYKDNINGFDNWAIINNIYNNVNTITKEMKIWSINQYYSWKEKYKSALDEINRLEQDSSEKARKYSLKNKAVTYLECNLCKNKLFHPTGTYILSADEILYLGECKYCGINVNKADAQFVSLYYGDYSENINEVSENLQDIMIDYLLSLEHNNEELIDKIIETLCENENILERLKYRFGYFIDDIVTRVAEEYFETRIYSYNDVMEDIIENKDCSIIMDIIHLFEYLIKNEELLNKIRLILILIDKIADINNNLGDKLKEYVNMDYISYHSGMYLNFDGNDVEREITFIVSFDINEVREKLEEAFDE